MEIHCKHTSMINFLHNELAIPQESITVALKHREQNTAPLHMILWEYGLVSLEQLSRIFDWLELLN